MKIFRECLVLNILYNFDVYGIFCIIHTQCQLLPLCFSAMRQLYVLVCVAYNAESQFESSQCCIQRSQYCLQGRVAVSATIGDLFHDFPFVHYSANLEPNEETYAYLE